MSNTPEEPQALCSVLGAFSGEERAIMTLLAANMSPEDILNLERFPKETTESLIRRHNLLKELLTSDPEEHSETTIAPEEADRFASPEAIDREPMREAYAAALNTRYRIATENILQWSGLTSMDDNSKGGYFRTCYGDLHLTDYQIATMLKMTPRRVRELCEEAIYRFVVQYKESLRRADS